MVPFKTVGKVSYSHSMVTMAILYSILRYREIMVEHRDFFISCVLRPRWGIPVRILPQYLVLQN